MHCDELSELYNEINSITKIIGKKLLCGIQIGLYYPIFVSNAFMLIKVSLLA